MVAVLGIRSAFRCADAARGVDGATADAETFRRAAALAATREWLASQSRVIEYWRDMLIDLGGAEEALELVVALDDHAAFLRAVGAET